MVMVKKEKPSLLIIDDEPEIRELLRDYLEPSFLVVACSPETAVETLRSRKFDLVLADLTMAELPWSRLSDAVQRHQLSTPVLVMSGHDPLHHSVQRALVSGALAFIEKPFSDLDGLLSLLRSHAGA